MEDGKYYLDLSDEGIWLIKHSVDKTQCYTAGYDKEKVVKLIDELNDAHRPNIEQPELNKIRVCWNLHEKGEKCDYVDVLGC
jgi:hypothetical protein